MRIRDIALATNSYALELCTEFFPNGTRVGEYFQVGSLEGERGQSLKVRLEDGRWFENAGSGGSGDMLDLIEAKLGLRREDACKWATDRFRLNETNGSKKMFRAKKEKITSPPRMPARLETSPNLHRYLESRGFRDPGQICLHWKLYETDDLNTGGNDIVYPFMYPDADEVVFLKNKPLDYAGRPGMCGQKGMRQCGYGWHMVPSGETKILIVEGEEDAIAGVELGYPTVSLPSGANSVSKLLEADFDRLDKFTEIFVATDQDEPGDRAAEALMAKFPGKAYRVRLPRKDINDLLMHDGYEAGAKILANAIDESWATPPHIVSPEDYAEILWQSFDPDHQEEAAGFGLGWSRAENIDLRFRKHDYWVFSGAGGSGKSMYLGQLCLNAIRQGKKCFIASFEMDPEDTLKRLTRQVCGLSGPSRDYMLAGIRHIDSHLQLYHDPVSSVANIDAVLEACEYAHRRFSTDVIVIDSLTCFANLDEDQYLKVHQVVQKICDFKRRWPVTIFLVTHTRKGDGRDNKTKDDVKGTSVITDLADGVLTLSVDSKKALARSRSIVPEGPDADRWDVWVSCVKNRKGSFMGAMGFNLDPGSLQYTDKTGQKVRYIDWNRLDG